MIRDLCGRVLLATSAVLLLTSIGLIYASARLGQAADGLEVSREVANRGRSRSKYNSSRKSESVS